MIYFDTSYLAKCYLNETGSAEVRQIAQWQPAVCCCGCGGIEVMSTFHRNLRDGLLAKSQFDTVARQFESDDQSGVWIWLPLTADLCRKTAARIKARPASTFHRD